MNKNIESYGSWMGGLFEAGGRATIILVSQTRRTKTYTSGYPYLAYTDNVIGRVLELKSHLGGSVFRQGKNNNSFTWNIQGDKAAELISIFGPYAPNRQDVVAASELWEQSTSEERVVLAKEMRGLDRIGALPSAESYKDLAENPLFVAGVFDCRGRGFREEHTRFLGQESSPKVVIHTTNRSLLEALHSRFEGSLNLVLPEGKEVVLTDGIFKARHSAYRLTFRREQALAFAKFITKGVILRRDDINTLLAV